jgi:hypothetical protein
MTLHQFKDVLTRVNRWLNTPASSTARPATLRWWVTPTAFDKYFARVILLATLASAFYLFGCNAAASGGQEYIGTWEHTNTTDTGIIGSSRVIHSSSLESLVITKDGDHFLIKQTKKLTDDTGKPTDLGTHTYPATLKDGILQLADGSSQPYTYVKATDTLVTQGSAHDIEYHRSKQ